MRQVSVVVGEQYVRSVGTTPADLSLLCMMRGTALSGCPLQGEAALLTGSQHLPAAQHVMNDVVSTQVGQG